MHTTNYTSTFIEVAPDSVAEEPRVPPERGGKPTVALMQFRMLNDHPYEYTSDDVVFTVFAERQGIARDEWAEQREAYFSVGRACLRSSDLGKRYGWGIHFDEQGRAAVYGVGTEEYQRLIADDSVKKLKAMRSKRA